MNTDKSDAERAAFEAFFPLAAADLTGRYDDLWEGWQARGESDARLEAPAAQEPAQDALDEKWLAETNARARHFDAIDTEYVAACHPKLAPPCQSCGKAKTRNPHEQAGDPSGEFGYVWECIPCLVKTRSAAVARFYKAEKELADRAEAQDAAIAMLRELVELKDLKDSLVAGHLLGQDHWARLDDYRRRKPIAWAAARALLADKEPK